MEIFDESWLQKVKQVKFDKFKVFIYSFQLTACARSSVSYKYIHIYSYVVRES